MTLEQKTKLKKTIKKVIPINLQKRYLENLEWMKTRLQKEHRHRRTIKKLSMLRRRYERESLR